MNTLKIKIFSFFEFIKIQTHFLTYINICFCLGIILQESHIFTTIVNIIFLLLFLYYAYSKSTEKCSKLLILFLIFIFGKFTINKQRLKYFNFKKIANERTFNIIGKVTNLENVDKKQIVHLKIEKLYDDNQYLYFNHNIQITLLRHAYLQPEDIIKINQLKFSYNANEAYEKYLIKENIYASLFCNKIKYKLLYRPRNSLFKKIIQIKNRLLNKIKQKMSPETFTLFCSIFMGHKKSYKENINDQKDKFNYWGLSHYLARSGLHLVIISAMWFFLLTILQISFKARSLIICFLILIYNIFTWNSVSFLRSFIMLLLYNYCIIFDLQINSLQLITLTCITMLISNPVQLFFLDFQLTFLLTYAIIWLNRINKQKTLI